MPRFNPGDVVIANNLSNEHYTITNQRQAFVGIVLGYQYNSQLLLFSLSSDLYKEEHTFYNQMHPSAYFHLKQAVTRLANTSRDSRVGGRILITLNSLFEGTPDIQKLFTDNEAVSLYAVSDNCFTLLPAQSTAAMLRSYLRDSPRLAYDLSAHLNIYHFDVSSFQPPKIFL